MGMKIWPKLGSFLRKPGRSAEESNLRGKANVNEEYREAFRTKSYLEMWGNKHGKLSSRSITNLTSSSSSPSSSSSSSSSLPNFYVEALLDPQQEALLSMLSGLNPDPLLMDYFKASLEACSICESLLRRVHQMRATHRRIKRVLDLSQKLFQGESSPRDPKSTRSVIMKEIARIALLKNPLSAITPLDFWKIRDSNTVLLRQLMARHKKVRRRAKLNRWCKNAGAIGVVALYGAVMITLMVLVVHSVVGAVAAPGLAACGVGVVRRGVKEMGMLRTTGALERVCTQLDVAAKGVYIMVNDLDTMSRLVRRLHDEVEHRRTVAGMCVRMRNGKADEVLKEVVREFCAREGCFLDQLEELEQHIHLCFLTINRSRRLVADQILVGC